MKTRNGFVSNSSSSAFIIPNSSLKRNEMVRVYHLMEKEGFLCFDVGGISIFHTTMDNSEIEEYLKRKLHLKPGTDFVVLRNV